MTSLHIQETPSAHSRTRASFWIGFSIFFVILLAKLVYVSLYATQIPFWDQWDELDFIYRPWFTGSWHWSLLFSPHNEHRIAWTRIVNLTLFTLNDYKFDNLVESYFNTALFAGLWTLAYQLFTWNETCLRRRVVPALAIVFLGILPFDWSNITIGFQSQFVFLEAFALILLGIASYCRLSWPQSLLLILVGTAGLFTMASGVLAIPAAIGVLIIRAWQERSLNKYFIVACLALFVPMAFGFFLVANSPSQPGYPATGILEFLRAFMVALEWPGTGHFGTLFIFIIWAPTLIWAWRFVWNQDVTAREIFAFGFCIWVLFQFLAMAGARAGGLQSLPSRYTEIPALGIVANLCLALRLRKTFEPRKNLFTRAFFPCVLILACQLLGKAPSDYKNYVRQHDILDMWTINTYNFIDGKGLPPRSEISIPLPYPSLSRIEDLLNSPVIRAMLLPKVSKGAPPAAPLSKYALKLQNAVQRWFAISSPTKLQLLPEKLFNSQANAVNGFCSIDQTNLNNILITNNEISIKTAQSVLQLQGWILNRRFAAPHHFLIEFIGDHDNNYMIKAKSGQKRADVKKAFKSNAADRSGYTAIAELNNIAPGSYKIMLAGHDHGHVFVCKTNKILLVNP